MARFHEGMLKSGMNEGRADDRAARGGHEIFGKSGGGAGGICTDLLASPMSPQMIPELPKEHK
jgi:hypothetical protein